MAKNSKLRAVLTLIHRFPMLHLISNLSFNTCHRPLTQEKLSFLAETTENEFAQIVPFELFWHVLKGTLLTVYLHSSGQ